MRFKLLLAILGLMVVAVYGTLAVLIFGFSGAGSDEAPPTDEEPAAMSPFSAREAYALAEAEARTWQADAQLVNASASWSNVTSEEELGQDVAWGFLFLSELSQEMQVLSVTRLGAERVRTMRSIGQSQVDDPSTWQVDSPEALLQFLDQGGRGFIDEHAGATVSLRISLKENDHRLVWLATAIHSADDASLVVSLDAETGALLGATP